MGYIDQKGQTMHSNESQEEQFLVFIHKYENAIKVWLAPTLHMAATSFIRWHVTLPPICG